MGTELHAFVDVDYDTVGEPFCGETATIRSFNFGEFSIRNSYELFDALGNGRSRHFPPESVERWALFPPRGLPLNASRGVVVRYSHPIADAQADAGRHWESHGMPGLPPVAPEEAARWVAEGWSHYYTPPEPRFSGEARVSHPEWRHSSWLLLLEVYRALAHFGLEVERLSAEVEAILGVMETFERRLGTGRSRLVFWFDN
jgi:hypothetical protein